MKKDKQAEVMPSSLAGQLFPGMNYALGNNKKNKIK